MYKIQINERGGIESKANELGYVLVRATKNYSTNVIGMEMDLYIERCAST